MRRLLLSLALTSAVLSGCSKQATGPAAPSAVAPPAVLVATQPLARSPAAVYDSEIWGQFDRTLDGRTVTPQTVFLKLDGQRVTITTFYEGITRRIFVRPTTVLALQRTYTVEFSPSVKTLDGTPLPPDVFFQFTTNSLRRIAYDYPADDALEGPVSTLGWGGTQGPDGNIVYDVYASDDSNAVSLRSLPPLQHSPLTRWLPATAWGAGSRTFWAVTSENQATHERMNGELRRFRVFDASTPLDSALIKIADFGSNDSRRPATIQSCGTTLIPAGPTFNAGFHWGYQPLGADARIAGATLRMFAASVSLGAIAAARPTVWSAQNDFFVCSMRGLGAPFVQLQLATGVPVGSSEADFTSDRLAALLEAQYRGRTLIYGTLVRTQAEVTFQSGTLDGDNPPQIMVRFYHLPASAAR